MAEYNDDLRHFRIAGIKDEKDPIWRYMDLSQFIDMIINEQLHFTQVAKIQEDPFDGSVLQYVIDTNGPIPNKNGRDKTTEIDKIERESTYVNCWNMNDIDNAALWKIHMKSNEGIAIKTTIKKLKDTLKQSTETYRFFIIPIDYNTDNIMEKISDPGKKDIYSLNSVKALFTKRQCFEYEKELRVAVRGIRKNISGFNWKIKPNELIEEIVLNPEAPDWLKPVIKKFIERYNITPNKVYRSNIIKPDRLSETNDT